MPSIPRLAAFAQLNDPQLEKDCVLSGGDDYELAFHRAARAAQAKSTRFPRELGVALTRIGAIQSGQPRLAVRRRGGQADARIRGGFDHFAQR